jgi:hypothetical protein
MDTNNPDDMAMAYEKLGEIVKRLELSKDKTMEYLMENDEDLINLKAWANGQGQEPTDRLLGETQGNTAAVHPTLHAKIGNETAWIMINTGASSLYICSDLITKLMLVPTLKENRRIEQMYGTVNKVVEIYEVTLELLAVSGYERTIECINAEKEVLTTLPNPRITDLKRRNPKLQRVSL